jgi:2-oxoglutarate dehydrogenase complex dehydrogenase (E1) component-like enzyme
MVLQLLLDLLSSAVQAVNPVVLGLVRAEQTALHRSGAVDSTQEAWRRVMPLQIHGDAAFSGLGIVLESLQLADLPGFSVGGSVHVIINNQVRARQQCSCVTGCMLLGLQCPGQPACF